MLGIFVHVVEGALREASPGAGGGARLGAVSFVHRFGASLNAHLHYPCCVVDGVFAADGEGRLRFFEATGLGEAEQAAVEAEVRARVLRRSLSPLARLPVRQDKLALSCR